MAYLRVIRDEKGAVAITIALLLIVFLGFTALVADYGYLAFIQRRLQTAADAAALAGAQELIYQGDQAAANVDAIRSKVVEYAAENDVLESELQSIDINTDEGYVKVIAGRTVGLFFANALGISSDERVARARAQLVWIKGLSGLVPFGVIDVRPDEVWAGFVGNLVKLSDPDNDSIYTGSVTSPSSAGGHTVIVKTVDNDTPANGLEVNAAAVVCEPSLVKRVTLKSDLGYNVSSPSSPISATIETGAPATPDDSTTVDLIVGGAHHTLSDDDGDSVYTCTFTSPPGDGTSAASYPVSVEVTRAGETTPIGPVSCLRIIDSYSVIGEVKASPTTVNQGSTVSLSVKIKGFEYGESYDLKIGSDPYAGNFMALAFDGESGGNAYMDHIENGSTSDYSIGDTLWTEPGNMQGPTDHGLDGRVDLDDDRWSSWSISEDKDLDCPRIITVPLVAATGYTGSNGRHEMVITGFANFFIDEWGKDNIIGYFMEYPEVGKDWTDEYPGDPLRPRTVRLVPFE